MKIRTFFGLMALLMIVFFGVVTWERQIGALLWPGAPTVIAVTAFLLFMVTVMGRAFGPTFKAARRHVRLRRELAERGTVMAATILRIIDTGVTLGTDPEVEVTVKTGEDTEATFRTTVSRLAIPRVGETMQVLVDPVDPTVAVRY